ncbi:MAG: hypothetical protein KBT46_03550 [Ruminococcus sp.]|nr:hypothetical protein [Candidatus Copronaster equi]
MFNPYRKLAEEAEAEYEALPECHRCFEHFEEDKMFCGWCADCLNEKVTYDTALEYFTENKCLVDFMVCKFYGCKEEPNGASEKFVEAMRENYQRMKADDLLCGKTDFLDCIKQYILTDDGDYGKSDFGYWLMCKAYKERK